MLFSYCVNLNDRFTELSLAFVAAKASLLLFDEIRIPS